MSDWFDEQFKKIDDDRHAVVGERLMAAASTGAGSLFRLGVACGWFAGAIGAGFRAGRDAW